MLEGLRELFPIQLLDYLWWMQVHFKDALNNIFFHVYLVTTYLRDYLSKYLIKAAQ